MFDSMEPSTSSSFLSETLAQMIEGIQSAVRTTEMSEQICKFPTNQIEES